MALWPKNWIECFITLYAAFVAATAVLVFAERLPTLNGLSAPAGTGLFVLGYFFGLASRPLRDDTRYQAFLTASLVLASIGVIAGVSANVR